MKQTLQLRLGQHLTMTPQLQQAIRLLQLSTLDLQQEVQEALESNLMLELDEGAAASDATGQADAGLEETASGTETDDDAEVRELDGEALQTPEEFPEDIPWGDGYDYPGGAGDTDFLLQRSAAPTLRDHLYWQMNLTPFGDTDLAIATVIIDSINDAGYLVGDLEDLRASLDDATITREAVEAVLFRIQNFDPSGVAARDPRECLLLQLQQLPIETPHRDAAIRLCRDHFAALAAQEHARIERELHIDEAELRDIMRLIRSLNPHPGAQIAESPPQYVIPDVFVYKRGEHWQVDLNPESTPRLRVNHDYAKLIRRADSSADNTCLKTHLQEARWFIKSLASRNETLLKVARTIVGFQHGFFERGAEAMRPLVLRDIADALQMHESTVSRVTTQKYMYTPRGTFEFKYFFSSHVSTAAGGECSATAIRALMKKLVAAETLRKPLSDHQIASLLADRGIQVARRTVAKYRESMGIPPSSERRRLI
jgi:RNA polymerase sigma-54 factor